MFWLLFVQLLIDYGLMKPLDKGIYYYMPTLQRSINKTSALIKRFMNKIDAQEISIPNLTPLDLWEKSGLYRHFSFNNHQCLIVIITDWIVLLWYHTDRLPVTVKSISDYSNLSLFIIKTTLIHSFLELGRLKDYESELFILKDRNERSMVLGPVSRF